MIDINSSLLKLAKSRKQSYQDKESEYDLNHKNESLTNSKIIKEKSSNNKTVYSGFAFSMGLKNLKQNNAHDHKPINKNRSFCRRKSKNNRSTIIKKERHLEVKHSKTNSKAFLETTASKAKRIFRSDAKLMSIDIQKGSINSIKSMKSLFNNEESLKEIIQIYKKYDDQYESKIIKKLKEVEDCSILKYGIKPSTREISYSYCLTCDSGLVNPICSSCLLHCHNNHFIKKNYLSGKIICSCGVKSHIISNEDVSNYNNNFNDCFCNEWGKTSKLNIYFVSSNQKESLCALCYNFCATGKNEYSPVFFQIKEGEDFPKCSCTNQKIHNEKRLFLNALDKMTLKYKKYDGFNLLFPTQILNLLMNSKKSFKHNFNDFYELFNALKNNNFNNSSIHYSLSKVDFYYTNCFLTMKIFLNIISFNSYENLSYYSEEVEKYFSFEIIQNLINNLNNCNLKEDSIWVLSHKYLTLFRKIYIGNKTQKFAKYKLEDLDNFSSSQRFSLFFHEENQTHEFQPIITFLIHYLQKINRKGFTSVEVIPCFGEIIRILKKLSYFYLLSNGDIIRILQELGKFFVNLVILRNYTKRFEKKGVTVKVLFAKNCFGGEKSNNSDMNDKKEFSSLDSDNEINEKSIGENAIEVISFDEEMPLYYTIIKMIRVFYLTYNDRLVQNIIVNNIKYKNDENFFNNDKISFGYMKNDFGRELFKVTIKILYTIDKYNKITEKNNSIYQKIIFHGRKLLEYSIIKKDSYLVSLIRTLINGDFYENKFNVFPNHKKKNEHHNNNKDNNENNNELNLFIQEKENLDKYNQQFLNFEINKEELIKNYEKSLDNILNDKFKERKIVGFSEDVIISIIKSKYFFTISKIYRILEYYYEIIRDENFNNKKATLLVYTKENRFKDDELINKLTPKIIFFYNNFIFRSSENCLLLLSHYIFNDLTKIPIKFCTDNFILFHSCLENISKNNYIENILNNSEHYLNNLYNYLHYLYEKKCKKINDCLLIFLKCFYKIALNIKTADYENLIKDIKRILIEINTLFNIAYNYFKYNEEGVSDILKKMQKDENEDESREFNEIENGKNNGFNDNIDINNINKTNEKMQINLDILEQCLIIDLKLINDFFDFSLYEQKEEIIKLIDVNKVIYCLKFQNISHLALRTQLIRYARKILIDMNYNQDSNLIYVNSIINNEDNLKILKISPLINNFKYPTKLLSYSKDFWNLSIKSKVNNYIYQSNSRIAEDILEEKNSMKEEEESQTVNSSNNLKKYEERKSKNTLNLRNLNLKENEDKVDDEELYKELKTLKNSFIQKKNNNMKSENIKCFDSVVYDLLINELNSVNDILSDINTSSNDEMQTLGEYFQSGLLIPIIFFFKKTLALAHNLTGEELVKLYELVVQTITLKITISEYKYNFWDNDNNNYGSNFEDDLFCTHMINSQNDILINGKYFIDGEIIKISNNILKTLKSKNFSCFDYTLLYNIVEKHLFCLISEYSQNSIGELFSEKEEDINLQFLNNPFPILNNNYSEVNEKYYKIYLLYKNNKDLIANEENISSFFNILPEICIEYETNFRNLLIFTLISITIKQNMNTDDNNDLNDPISLYFFLYKLLSLQTSKTQLEIMNLLGNNENENLGFMLTYSQNLLKRIILIFIDEFNPRDKYYDDNFIVAINLIKIFKFLCEEHNNFFQMRLINVLNYQYKRIVPFFNKENKSFKEYQNQYANSVIYNFNFGLNFNDKEKVKTIYFFDFFLFVLLKISLISRWNELKGLSKLNSLKKQLYISSHDENENIYDLFSSIIEMLNEMIQGNKEENLKRLGNPFYKDNDNNSSDEDDEYKDLISKEVNLINGNKDIEDIKFETSEKYILKKRIYQKLRIEKDPFTCFLRGMIEFIFIDSNNSQTLYQLRNDLMLFFTSILEEKNCNEEVQKLIMKYLNTHRLFSSISIIFKNYFLANVPQELLSSDFFPTKIQKNGNTTSLSFDNYLTQKNSTMEYNKSRNNTVNNVQTNNKDDSTNRINNIILREKLIFDHRLLNYYYEHYYSNKDFFISNEFQLANAFYKYIKLISALGKNEEIRTIIEDVNITPISTAIKKFASNIMDIKKGDSKSFNNKKINNQIKLSKSLRNIKSLKIENIKSRKKSIKANKSFKLNKLTNIQMINKIKKKSFMSTIYTNKNLVKRLGLEDGYEPKTPRNGNTRNNNLFKSRNFENSDSSERVLGFEKKESESTVQKLESVKSKAINEDTKNQSNENIAINKYNLKNKTNDEGTESKNNKEFNMNLNSNENKGTINLDIHQGQRRRFSTLFRLREKKVEKYSLINNNAKEYCDKEYIERFYIIKFFESITSTVEVRNEDHTNQTVIFTHLPEMIYLSNGTKSEFEQNVNRSSETSKKNDLIRHLGYFQKEIEYYKKDFSILSYWVSKVDFLYVKWASYLYALLLNLLALFTIIGDNKLSITHDDSYDVIKSRRNDRVGIQQRIDNSINRWHKIYEIINYIYLVLNALLIYIWIYFRSPLYYEMDKIKYFEENIHKKTLNICDKLYIFIVMTLWDRNYISSLIYGLVISILCSILKRGELILPFLLLSIVDLNVTLKNVILSIKLRHKEFTRAMFLAFIFMYSMSNLAFFFFNSDYIEELDYYDDNYCKSLKFCVFNAIDNGLRARGGIGDSGKRISFMKNKSHYIERLILDDIFFLLVVIILIDLVFGIIIGEFDALRGQEQKYETDRLYQCFICHVNKNTLEKNRQNFYIHVNKIHNMWNYVSYMIFVKLSNLHDLNSINSYVRNKIDNKDISWLPSYKDLIKSDDENYKEDEYLDNEDFKIEEENLNNYYIAKPT